tara:strand:- start:40037 stop:41866 length:1830 start_codon:yes stop_codon:yes gene_type:complete
MFSQYNKVDYNTTPEILEVHGGEIIVNIEGVFPERYFSKKAQLKITPVIVVGDTNSNASQGYSEYELEPIIIQGEHASGGHSTIFYESGGKFTYTDRIKYTNDLRSCYLELRAEGTLGDQVKSFGNVNISEGVITTSRMISPANIDVRFANHEYKEIETISETATIYFLVNESNIRTTEKSDADVMRLKDFIKLGYETESFIIKSSASPEGTEKKNSELSDNRQNSTLEYAKYLMNKLNANGSSEDSLYKLTSAGADWDGFNELVNQSSIVEKGTILSISNRNSDKSQKERGELLKDMSEVYEALENDVLQYLRKSEITINSYLPKRTKEEIIELCIDYIDVPIINSIGMDSLDVDGNQITYVDTVFNSKCIDLLTINELLYAVDILPNDLGPYIYVALIQNNTDDWRPYNNLAALYIRFYEGGYQESIELRDTIFSLLDKSKLIGGDKPEILFNLGKMYIVSHEYEKAKELFELSGASSEDMAILYFIMGDYRSASRYYRGMNTYQSSLTSLLNGNYKNLCDQGNSNNLSDSLNCYLINAYHGARSENDSLLFSNIEDIMNLNPYFSMFFAEFLRTDLEFKNYFTHEKFISLTSNNIIFEEPELEEDK